MKILSNKYFAYFLSFIIITITLFSITGTLGKYLFDELRPAFWYGFEKVTKEQIRVVKVDYQDIIFSNGERINGNLMIVYNLVATLIVFYIFYYVLYFEFYFITHILGYDILKVAGFDSCPPLSCPVASRKSVEKEENDVKSDH